MKGGNVVKAYSRRGGEFLVNTQTAGGQQGPRLAALNDGGFIVVWTDGSLIGGDSSGVGVKAQRFDASGHAVGGEFLVNTTTSGNQSSPAVAELSSGRFIITWTDASATGGDTSGNAVRGQLFAADGTPVGGEFLVNTAVAGNQGPAVVAELANGGFVIAWTDASGQGGDTSGTGIKAQIFDADGARVGGEFLANTTTFASQSGASVTSLASGGFAIAWTDSAGAHFQQFDATGAKVGAEQLVNALSAASYFVSGVTIASVGSGFVVTWGQADSPPVSGQPVTFDVREQRFDASGNKVGSEAIVNTTREGTQTNPDVHALPGGGYLITWQGPGDGTSGLNVYGQAFDAAGAKIGSEFLLETTTDGNQTSAKVTTLASGDIVLTWTDTSGSGGDASGAGIKAQLLTPTTDAPTDIALSNLLVSETSVENLPVATLGTTSSALFKAFSYTIVADSSGGAFGIDGDKLVVVDSSKLDFETHPNLDVTIRATDLNGATYDKSFALGVTDAAIEERYFASSEFGLSDDTTGFNTPLAVVPLTSGGFLAVTWDSLIGVTDKVHGRIFVAAGHPVAGAFEIPMPFTGSSFGGASALPGGGFVVAYRGGSINLGGGSNGFPIRAQVYDASGHPIGSDVLVSTTNYPTLLDPRVTTLASGNFVVTWSQGSDEGDDPGATMPSQIRGRIFTAAGTPVGGDFRANTTTVGAQVHSHVAALPGGGFVVTWQDSDLQGVDGQIFDAAGNKVGGEFAAVADLPGLGSSDVTVLASGNILVTWSNLIDNSGAVPVYVVGGQLVSPQGAPIGDRLELAPATDSVFHIAAAPGGGFALGVSPISPATLNPDDHDAWVQIFNDAGAPVGDPFTLASTSDDESIGGMAALADGAFAFAWSRGFVENGAWTSDAYGRVVSLVPPNHAPVASVPGAQTGRQDTNLVFGSAQGNAIVISDADAGNGNETVTLTVAHGTLTLPNGNNVTVVGDGTGTVQITGTVANVNAVLDGLLYKGSLNYHGGDTIDVVVNDNGNSGPGGALTDHRTVAITLVSPSGVIDGNAGDDLLTGTAGNDFFRLQQGGNDTVSGGGGNDVFLFGATLTSADVVDGGAGNDQIAIQGDYWTQPLVLGAGVVGVESIALLPGSDTRFGDPGTNLYSYDITTLDQNVAAGTTLVVDGSRLAVGEDLRFNGSAESDGAFFVYGGGGTDTLTGGAKNDVFLFGNGGQWGASDSVDGGAGTDQLALRGNYNVTFGADQIHSIESLALMSAFDTRYGSAAVHYDYVIVMNDGNVAAGKQMTVDAGNLRGGETLTFDGSAELDGSFRIFGGQGADHITGSQGNDILVGALGGDWMDGQGGNDTFRYRSADESSSTHYDTIVGFDAAHDVIDLPVAVAGWGTDAQGSLSDATFDQDLANALAGHMGAHQAVLFTASGGDHAGQTFLVVDADGDGLYQADHDYVIQLVNPATPVSTADTHIFV